MSSKHKFERVRGMRANSDFSPGDLMVYLPNSVVISSRHAMEALKEYDVRQRFENDAIAILAFFVLYET